MEQPQRESVLSVEQSGNVTFMILTGAVETLRSLELEEDIRPYVEAKDPKLVFDLSGVTHLSSSGIRVLLTALREVDTKGGKLVLCSLSEVVVKMVEAIELDQVFDIYKSRGDALRAIED